MLMDLAAGQHSGDKQRESEAHRLRRGRGHDQWHQLQPRVQLLGSQVDMHARKHACMHLRGDTHTVVLLE